MLGSTDVNRKESAEVLSNKVSRGLVLVVDDEDSIRGTLSSVLEDELFQTVTAVDGPDAIEKLKEFKPDLIFLDIWMPGWDGIETLEKIKEFDSDVEVIVMSGHATIANALDAMKRGAFDFIEKPFDIEGVLSVTERALENRRSKSVSDSQAESISRSRRNSVYSFLCHPGIKHQGLSGRNRGQRSLKRSAVLYGHCLHSGKKSGLVLEPLPLDSGIHFGKIGDSKTVPAFVDYVHSTQLATSIRSGVTSAATIEHLMSALHVYGISNLLIKCNGEVPIFDGSALQFCEIIDSVGIEEQGGEWFELCVDEKLTFKADDADGRELLSIEPSDKFSVTYHLDYPAPVGRQEFIFTLDSVESFVKEIAPARTFGFMKDIERLQKAGLAAGGRLDNFILIGSDKVINTELRFPDELVRHKILDVIGDLFLLGRPLCGHVHASMSGHSDNVQLLTKVKQLAGM